MKCRKPHECGRMKMQIVLSGNASFLILLVTLSSLQSTHGASLPVHSGLLSRVFIFTYSVWCSHPVMLNREVWLRWLHEALSSYPSSSCLLSLALIHKVFPECSRHHCPPLLMNSRNIWSQHRKRVYGSALLYGWVASLHLGCRLLEGRSLIIARCFSSSRSSWSESPGCMY